MSRFSVSHSDIFLKNMCTKKIPSFFKKIIIFSTLKNYFLCFYILQLRVSYKEVLS